MSSLLRVQLAELEQNFWVLFECGVVKALESLEWPLVSDITKLF